MARCHARFAARAAVEIDIKEGELLAGSGRARRQQCRVVPALEWLDRVLVKLRESLDARSSRLARSRASDQQAAAPGVPRHRPGKRDRHGTEFLVEAHRLSLL